MINKLTLNQSWISYFLAISKLASTRSKDRSRKVGSVIVGLNKEIKSTGYNGFPRGIDDTLEVRHQRPLKYKWTEHAERNAIYNAARAGIALEGCSLFTILYPCADCARAIIQSGLVAIYCPEPNWDLPNWAEDFKIVKEMLEEASIEVVFIKGED